MSLSDYGGGRLPGLSYNCFSTSVSTAPNTSKKTYWHTPEDTIDKLSTHSFEVLGAVLTEVLKQL